MGPLMFGFGHKLYKSNATYTFSNASYDAPNMAPYLPHRQCYMRICETNQWILHLVGSQGVDGCGVVVQRLSLYNEYRPGL